MQRTAVGFEASYRRHLAAEQRRAVLDALTQTFDDESTVGQIVDAAVALGYVGLGDLSLADLADALLTDARASQAASSATASDAEASDADEDEDDDEPAVAASDDEDEDEEEEDEEEEEEEVAKPAKTRGRAKKPAGKGKAAKTKPAPAKPAAKAPAGKGKPTKISLDDRMSLAEAAAVLLPLVRGLGQATMQQLEQATEGAGRRKLRFHIGQLVRNGHLERHGMGRGTYYTVA
ncbi:MAG TPA: hypothetical protein VG755_07090 [Nannocystaceae bacterium]|nr:hypothetical protein [Nannocystaceae bacterium]